MPFARLQRRLVAGYSLRECEVHVGKSNTGAGKGGGHKSVHHAPSLGLTGMSGEFPAPQKGDPIVELAACRSAVHIGCEGLLEEPECCRRIAGLEVTECEMPIEVAP